MRKGNILLLGVIVMSASEIVWQLYKKFNERRNRAASNGRTGLKTDANGPKANISEVMFFSKDSSLCRAHTNSKEACLKDSCPANYLRRLENYLNRAEQSLDVCMYIMTCESLSSAIVNAHRRGVVVRIIMDGRMAGNDYAQTAVFHKNGIAIKMQHSDNMMHHKFAIVDGDILITGSTNWTMSAFFGNSDNIMITNQRALVKPFVAEFQKLWEALESRILSGTEDKLDQPVCDSASGIQ
ncbi:mitochondrial cardiolipin hydrolase zuc [Andrena cerasifolii]|uniref:mitochondrial cardiolipin hydrolase zuc n=1 Tax=Andrena cerasifolii TaxID=2819439 RepID=UPI004037E488